MGIAGLFPYCLKHKRSVPIVEGNNGKEEWVMFGNNERYIWDLKYYLIWKGDKSRMEILQSNCYVLNHALKHFNFLLICYLLTKFEQSEATGPLFLPPTFVSFFSFSLFYFKFL
jgi:hypothetical protein